MAQFSQILLEKSVILQEYLRTHSHDLKNIQYIPHQSMARQLITMYEFMCQLK